MCRNWLPSNTQKPCCGVCCKNTINDDSVHISFGNTLKVQSASKCLPSNCVRSWLVFITLADNAKSMAQSADAGCKDLKLIVLLSVMMLITNAKYIIKDIRKMCFCSTQLSCVLWTMEMIDVFLEDAGAFNDLETLNDGEK